MNNLFYWIFFLWDFKINKVLFFFFNRINYFLRFLRKYKINKRFFKEKNENHFL